MQLAMMQSSGYTFVKPLLQPTNRQQCSIRTSRPPHQCSTVHSACFCSNSTSNKLHRQSSTLLPHRTSVSHNTVLSLLKQPSLSSNNRQSAIAAAGATDNSSALPEHNEHSSDSSADSSAERSGVRGMLQQWNQDTKKMRAQLQSLGLAGVVAYGLFNTAYYTVAFLFIWFTVANVPAGLGLQAAARKAAEVFALVWAGSQVTKLLRAAGALACAPLVDQGLVMAVEKFRLKSKRQAFVLVVAACLMIAGTVFGFVVAMHA